MYKSSLDDIKGIGKVRKNLLLKSFSSLEEIKTAPEEKLLKLGIPKDVINNIKKKL